MLEGGIVKKEQYFQIRSKQDARYFAKILRSLDKDFYYHIPLVGGMDGSFVTIHRDSKSNKCEIYSSIPGYRNGENKRVAELVEHIWKERRFINAELRRTDSEWYHQFKISR